MKSLFNMFNKSPKIMQSVAFSEADFPDIWHFLNKNIYGKTFGTVWLVAENNGSDRYNISLHNSRSPEIGKRLESSLTLQEAAAYIEEFEESVQKNLIENSPALLDTKRENVRHHPSKKKIPLLGN